MFDTMGVAINGLRTRIDKTLLEDRERRWMSDSQNSLREFYKTDVIPMSASLSKNLKELKEELVEEVQEMLNIFESMEQKVNGKSSKENIIHNEIDRLLKSIFSSCYLFRNPFSSTTIGDENPIRTLGDYSKPSHEGYRNTIDLHLGNNMVPLRSDTIRLVQNGCSFHGIRSEDPNQHLKDFLKLVDSLDLDDENRERTRLRLFQFSLRDQASNWLERLPAGSISTWEDLTTRFLARFFLTERTAKLCNGILMFQQHHGESLSEAWTRFKDLLQKVPCHGIDIWHQVQIFYDHVNTVTRRIIDQSTGGKLRDLNPEESWAILEDLALYDNES
ncbi:zinc finger, CCHC-type containing protein [Tanacetum coccineum]